ncbi:hypothetical protein EVAR_38221_1 [Eumeta japonica]|uniref:Uncharacterized protein n=1 Tax=Eumeta variegata TaxID=151549 RepID=A0A4C1XIU4_EUMVA|nr:hypothetical protein EVAR_38221_1 [Eumeta japonica]
MAQNRNAAEKKKGSGSVILAQYFIHNQFTATQIGYDTYQLRLREILGLTENNSTIVHSWAQKEKTSRKALCDHQTPSLYHRCWQLMMDSIILEIIGIRLYLEGSEGSFFIRKERTIAISKETVTMLKEPYFDYRYRSRTGRDRFSVGAGAGAGAGGGRARAGAKVREADPLPEI